MNRYIFTRVMDYFGKMIAEGLLPRNYRDNFNTKNTTAGSPLSEDTELNEIVSMLDKFNNHYDKLTVDCKYLGFIAFRTLLDTDGVSKGFIIPTKTLVHRILSKKGKNQINDSRIKRLAKIMIAIETLR